MKSDSEILDFLNYVKRLEIVSDNSKWRNSDGDNYVSNYSVAINDTAYHGLMGNLRNVLIQIMEKYDGN